MQSRNGIGKEWANKILAEGYQMDNREPNKTKAKVWNKSENKFEEIELTSTNTKKYKQLWRGDMIR